MCDESGKFFEYTGLDISVPLDYDMIPWYYCESVSFGCAVSISHSIFFTRDLRKETVKLTFVWYEVSLLWVHTQNKVLAFFLLYCVQYCVFDARYWGSKVLGSIQLGYDKLDSLISSHIYYVTWPYRYAIDLLGNTLGSFWYWKNCILWRVLAIHLYSWSHHDMVQYNMILQELTSIFEYQKHSMVECKMCISNLIGKKIP